MDESVFDRAKEFAKSIFEGDSSGHDIHHTIRVHDLARTICSEEGGDEDIVRLSALLHDVDDRKLGQVAAQTVLDMIKGEKPGNQLMNNYQIILL